MPKFISQYIPNWETSKFSFLSMLSSIYYVQNHPTDIRTKNIQILKFPVLELLRFAEPGKYKINKLSIGLRTSLSTPSICHLKKNYSVDIRILHAPERCVLLDQWVPWPIAVADIRLENVFLFFFLKSQKGNVLKGSPCCASRYWYESKNVQQTSVSLSMPLINRPHMMVNWN